MNEEYCHQVRMSAMAARDGEAAPLSPDEIAEHLRVCPACREEVGSLGDLLGTLDRQQRRTSAEDLWPLIAVGLRPPAVGARPGPRVFVLLGGLLVACKLIDKMGGLGLPLFVRVLPLILVVAGFSWMRVNPFKIDPELELEGK